MIKKVKPKKEKIILVVEDEQPLLEAIKIKLEKNNFATISARSVEQALNLLEDIKKVDAIWLDHYLLGKKNGLDFVAHLKEKKSKWNDLPIFVISNTASPDKVQTYLNLGATKFYVKAEKRLDEIISEIKKYLKIN
jgi:DNA-binding response OmpR family regulator